MQVCWQASRGSMPCTTAVSSHQPVRRSTGLWSGPRSGRRSFPSAGPACRAPARRGSPRVSEIRSRSLAMGPPPHRVRVGPHYPSLPAAPGANTLAGLHRAAGAARQPPSAHGPACGCAGRRFTRHVAGPDRTSFSDGASRQRAPCRAVLDSVEGINGTGKSYLANRLLRTTATPAESCCPGHACGSRFQRGRLSCGHQDSGSSGSSQ